MKINEIELAEGVYDPHIFKAVFTAGSPGAGKSTIASKVLGGTGLKSLNIDNFWTLYNKMGKDANKAYPSDYRPLYVAQENNFLGGRLGLIIDGTARNPQRLGDTKRKLEALGYDTAMIFVNTSLDTSIQRVIARAEQTGRRVDPAFVKQAWEHTQQGLGKLQNMFGRNFYIIDNNRTLNDLKLDYVEKSLMHWLERAPSKKQARDWMAHEIKRKRREHRGGFSNENS